jgi:hypothetical protein
LKTLACVRVALEKHQQFPAIMRDKDWIDIFRWVLPESNAVGFIKDLTKRDAIVAKLESLEQPWMSYFPPAAAV